MGTSWEGWHVSSPAVRVSRDPSPPSLDIPAAKKPREITPFGVAFAPLCCLPLCLVCKPRAASRRGSVDAGSGPDLSGHRRPLRQPLLSAIRGAAFIPNVRKAILDDAIGFHHHRRTPRAHHVLPPPLRPDGDSLVLTRLHSLLSNFPVFVRLPSLAQSGTDAELLMHVSEPARFSI